MSTQFNDQQIEIISHFGKGQAVMAGAGCGKTTTLVAKCLELLKQNPQGRFCAVSFTEKSVRDLREALTLGLHREGFYDQRHHHWIRTIHGLCSTIIREFPTAAGLQGGERVLLEDESSRLWQRAIDALWRVNENAEINEAVTTLLKTYSKTNLEALLYRIKNLISFGANAEQAGQLLRDEVRHLWLCFDSVHRRYLHSKIRMGAMDFNDLETYALKALEQPWVRQHFHKLFDLVLVDEFQDTNPVQGKILEYFARPGFTNLCIVGDPKQSIYRFRDADVGVFFDLTERLPLKHLLTENYRSRPAIIDFVNQVCAPVFEASQLTYEPLMAGRSEENTGDQTARVWRLPLKSESDLSHFLKLQVQNGIDLSEFVILARSMKGKVQKILQAFNQAGVPYVLGSGGRFFADPRVQELVAFLKGFISSAHRHSQWTALRSPWIAVSEEKLLEWKENFYAGFFASDHGLALRLQKIYQNKGEHRPGEILEKMGEAPFLPAEMQIPVLSLWHQAETLSSQGLRFEDVIRTFDRAIETDKLEKEIPPPAQKGAVRVMTIHGSKGLQFPRVILADFDGPYRNRGGFKDLIWDRKNGVFLYRRDETGSKIKKDPDNDFWSELETRNAVAESKRLFYVAITRAQEELIFLWPEESKKPSTEPLKNDDWRSWVSFTQLPVEKDFSTTTAAAQLKTNTAPLAPLQTIENNFEQYRPRHSPSEWRILDQCELRYFAKWVNQNQESTLQEHEFDFATLKVEKKKEQASEKGERVHLLLETENWSELADEFSPQYASELIEELKNKLTSSESKKIFREFGFEIPLNDDEALVGMMDRLEVDEINHTIKVIDYKWTEKDKSEVALLGDYRLQLQLYAWAASKMVTFAPKKLEAEILHLTAGGIKIVKLNSSDLDLAFIEKNVFDLHRRAAANWSKSCSKNQPTTPAATLGDHCKYCDHKSQCAAFNASGD